MERQTETNRQREGSNRKMQAGRQAEDGVEIETQTDRQTDRYSTFSKTKSASV